MLDATPLLRLYAGWRSKHLDAEDPRTAQEAELMKLVRKAAVTEFGRRHDFARIGTVAEFQKRVPLRRYEAFWQDYWQPRFPRLDDCTWPGRIPYFALTAGTTTGKTKHIPVSREMVAANRRATLDMLTHHLRNRPRSRILAGRNFMLGGSTNLVAEAPGVLSGDLSGIAANEIPRWARPRYYPPRELALLSDWEVKIERLARLSLDADIRTISGTPSWLLIFFDRLAMLRPERPHRLASWYPNLELLVHGGVNFAPYRPRFEALLEGSRAELREVYPASEGFIAVADKGPGEGLRMILDNGLFYEFVPVEELEAAEPTRHWIANADPGVNYALVLSSCAGLWSYVLGDTVRLVSREPPRLLITGRTSYVLSAFGEHLIDEEIEGAVASAAKAADLTVGEYTVAPLFPEKPGELGRHLFILEFAGTPQQGQIERFAQTLDQALADTNEDYKAHRAGGFGMAAPEVRAVPIGAFAAWMKARGQLGGQHKVPRIINDAELLRSLLASLLRQ
jgi:hypothetical protein